MKFALVADDGQGRVVTNESDDVLRIQRFAERNSTAWWLISSTAKWHVCRREPSPNGENLVTIETWEKGVKL